MCSKTYQSWCLHVQRMSYCWSALWRLRQFCKIRFHIQYVSQFWFWQKEPAPISWSKPLKRKSLNFFIYNVHSSLPMYVTVNIRSKFRSVCNNPNLEKEKWWDIFAKGDCKSRLILSTAGLHFPTCSSALTKLEKEIPRCRVWKKIKKFVS